MIRRADAQGKRGEAKRLYEVLARFLDGLPADKYQEELDELARYRKQLSGGARDGKR